MLYASTVLKLVFVGCFLVLQTNNPPEVTITKPSATERFNWHTLVSYQLAVTDKEDGTSAFDEIAPNEVFLKVRYLPDSAALKNYLEREANHPEPKELTLIKSSDCFNCHAFKTKLIGPAFETIAKQHPSNPDTINLLARKIINGSGSVTGTERMPPHPDLPFSTATEMVRWILKNSADPELDYLRGLEGAFRTRRQPEKNAGAAVYILTASYTDHGLPQAPESRKGGKYILVLRSN